MDAPTHLDAFRALLSSCLPCTNRPLALPPSPTLGPRSNDLDALLRPPSSDLDTDTDAMSLHSTFGSNTRSRRKKKNSRMPKLCGVNLFGKPRIALESDDDDDQQRARRPQSQAAPPATHTRYDSDASPLPDATIDSLANPSLQQPPRMEESPEEELARLRAEKAARKARRRDRRERKAAKHQLTLVPHDDDFEGYPGSGSGLGEGLPISPPSTTTTTPGIDNGDPEDDDADMGAAAYTRSSGRSVGRSGSSSGTGTGTGTSRSGRSRSGTNIGANALGLGIQRGPPSPLAQSHVPTPPPPPPPPVVETEVLVQPKAETPEPASLPDEAPLDSKEIVLPSSKDTSPSPSNSDQPRAPRPKIHISNLTSNTLPMSSPGAGPGPRTMEASPRISDSHLPSPRPSGFSSNGGGFPSPRLGGAGAGFPSPGLGLSGMGGGFPSPRIGGASPLVGGGLNSGGGGFPFGPGRKGSVTAGMGVALANRGE